MPAARWAMETTLAYAQDKMLWGIPVVLVSSGIAALLTARRGNPWRPVLSTGILGAIGGPVIVFIGGIALNILRFPVTHESDFDALASRILALESRPAISGTNDTQLKQLSDVVTALSRKIWAEQQIATFKAIQTGYSEITKKYLETFWNQNAHARAGLGIEIAMTQSQIATIVKSDFGDTVDFEKYPEYARDHYIAAPHLDEIKDEGTRQIYMRLFNQYETSQKTLADILGRYYSELSHATDVIMALGRKPIPSP